MIVYKIRENMLKLELRTGYKQTYSTVAQGADISVPTIAKLASQKTEYYPSIQLVDISPRGCAQWEPQIFLLSERR